MATFAKFEVFTLDLGKEFHNFSSDVIKLALSNTAPSASADAVLADITEITAANGYVAGGMTLDSVTWTQASGTATLDCADEVLTASGGSIGPFQYAIIYNDTSASDSLIGYWDLGAAQTILDAASRRFIIDPSGVLEVT